MSNENSAAPTWRNKRYKDNPAFAEGIRQRQKRVTAPKEKLSCNRLKAKSIWQTKSGNESVQKNTVTQCE